METKTTTSTISLKAKAISTRFNSMGISWCMAYVDYNFCFNRNVFLFNSNLIAN